MLESCGANQGIWSANMRSGCARLWLWVKLPSVVARVVIGQSGIFQLPYSTASHDLNRCNAGVIARPISTLFCRAGQTYCDENMRVECNEFGRMANRTDCALDMGVCLEGQCVATECGDGRVDPTEACDDNGDSRTQTACLREIVSRLGVACGLWDGEEACDDGNDSNQDGCTTECELTRCGDGVVRNDLQFGMPGYEACDDGDNNDFNVHKRMPSSPVVI